VLPHEHAFLSDLLAEQATEGATTAEQELGISWTRESNRRRHEVPRRTTGTGAATAAG
jgi:hypothetical protein